MTLTETELIDRFARAVARQEGFFDKRKIPTVGQRCNNPGNLTHWRDPQGNPFPQANGYVMFPDEKTGWRALKAQCRINIMKRRLTFLEFFAGRPGVYSGFCPRDDNRDRSLRKNDPVAYARKVLVSVAGPDSDYEITSPIITLLGGPSAAQSLPAAA